MTTIDENIREYEYGIGKLGNRISELKKQLRAQKGNTFLAQRIFDLEGERGEMIQDLHLLKEYFERTEQ